MEPSIDVYGVFGHGCDILTGHESENIPVPPGIIYVTIALCGLVSIDLLKLMYAFEDVSIWPALRDPVRNEELLRKYFEDHMLRETHLIIHKEGGDYIDSLNTMLYNGSNKIFKSGLYRLGEFQPVRPDLDYTTLFGRSSRVIVPEPYSANDMRAIYSGSRIQPTNYGPFATADEFKAANPVMTIKLSQVFQSLRDSNPAGTFVMYNFACRTVCESPSRNVQLRSLARRVRNLPPNMLRDRITPLDVDSQVEQATRMIVSDAAHVSMKEWVQRKKVTDRERRMYFAADVEMGSPPIRIQNHRSKTRSKKSKRSKHSKISKGFSRGFSRK